MARAAADSFFVSCLADTLSAAAEYIIDSRKRYTPLEAINAALTSLPASAAAPAQVTQSAPAVSAALVSAPASVPAPAHVAASVPVSIVTASSVPTTASASGLSSAATGSAAVAALAALPWDALLDPATYGGARGGGGLDPETAALLTLLRDEAQAANASPDAKTAQAGTSAGTSGNKWSSKKHDDVPALLAAAPGSDVLPAPAFVPAKPTLLASYDASLLALINNNDGNANVRSSNNSSTAASVAASAALPLPLPPLPPAAGTAAATLARAALTAADSALAAAGVQHATDAALLAEAARRADRLNAQVAALADAQAVWDDREGLRGVERGAAAESWEAALAAATEAGARLARSEARERERLARAQARDQLGGERARWRRERRRVRALVKRANEARVLLVAGGDAAEVLAALDGVADDAAATEAEDAERSNGYEANEHDDAEEEDDGDADGDDSGDDSTLEETAAAVPGVPARAPRVARLQARIRVLLCEIARLNHEDVALPYSEYDALLASLTPAGSTQALAAAAAAAGAAGAGSNGSADDAANETLTRAANGEGYYGVLPFAVLELAEEEAALLTTATTAATLSSGNDADEEAAQLLSAGGLSEEVLAVFAHLNAQRAAVAAVLDAADAAPATFPAAHGGAAALPALPKVTPPPRIGLRAQNTLLRLALRAVQRRGGDLAAVAATTAAVAGRSGRFAASEAELRRRLHKSQAALARSVSREAIAAAAAEAGAIAAAREPRLLASLRTWRARARVMHGDRARLWAVVDSVLGAQGAVSTASQPALTTAAGLRKAVQGGWDALASLGVALGTADAAFPGVRDPVSAAKFAAGTVRPITGAWGGGVGAKRRPVHIAESAIPGTHMAMTAADDPGEYAAYGDEYEGDYDLDAEAAADAVAEAEYEAYQADLNATVASKPVAKPVPVALAAGGPATAAVAVDSTTKRTPKAKTPHGKVSKDAAEADGLDEMDSYIDSLLAYNVDGDADEEHANADAAHDDDGGIEGTGDGSESDIDAGIAFDALSPIITRNPLMPRSAVRSPHHSTDSYHTSVAPRSSTTDGGFKPLTPREANIILFGTATPGGSPSHRKQDESESAPAPASLSAADVGFPATSAQPRSTASLLRTHPRTAATARRAGQTSLTITEAIMAQDEADAAG